MTAPPFEKIFSDGLAQVRDALNHAPQAARAEVQQVLDSDELVSRVVNIVVPVMDNRFRRRYYRSIILGVGALLLIFATAMFIGFDRINTIAAANASQDAALARTESTIAAFQAQLDEANIRLVAQGLPPVQGPVDAQPGTREQAELINAAATASTLASLPPQVLVRPTATELAAAVAAFVQGNPIAVSPEQIIAGVAAYLAENPPEPGRQGDPGRDGVPGPPGPPPTVEEIRQAFRDEIATNPNLLCPLGGAYGSREMMLANGGSTTEFSCFGSDTVPPGTGGGGDPGTTDPGGTPGNTDGGGAATPPSSNDGGVITTPPTAPPAAGPPAGAPQDADPAPAPEPDPGFLGNLLGP
jgi:hypothetical protein